MVTALQTGVAQQGQEMANMKAAMITDSQTTRDNISQELAVVKSAHNLHKTAHDSVDTAV